jgi:hypothetical protein
MSIESGLILIPGGDRGPVYVDIQLALCTILLG